MLEQVGCVLAVELVLTGAGKGAVDRFRNLPDPGSCKELCTIDFGRDFGEFPTADLLEIDDLIEIGDGETVLNIECARAVRKRHDLGTELDELLGGVGGDIAGAGDRTRLAFEVVFSGLEHVLGEVDAAVASSLRTDQRTAERRGFAGDDTTPLVRDLAVLPEEVADLASANVHVAGGDIGVRTDMAVELGHEALAEAHHLSVATSLAGSVRTLLGIEVRAAFAAAERKSGERVLENLLEAEKLQNREIDRRIEAQSPFVGPDCGVELHAIAAVDADDAGIVHPRNTEHDDPFRFHQSLENGVFAVFGMGFDDGSERGEDFLGGLEKLRLFGVLRLEIG